MSYFVRIPKIRPVDMLTAEKILRMDRETIRTGNDTELATRVLTRSGEYGAALVGRDEAAFRMHHVADSLLEETRDLDDIVLALKLAVHPLDHLKRYLRHW